MEWMNKGGQPGQAPQPHQATPAAHGSAKRGGSSGMKLAFVAMLFLTTILAVLVIIGIARGGSTGGSTAGKFVDKSKMQAVFLNGGQVYFGKISDLGDKSLRMADIYYLRVNQTVQPNQSTANQNNNDISLVKLGCELHGPQDSMVINQEQVIFWENLKDDGQVAKAVAEYVKQNPDGQKCEQQQQQSGGTNTNPAPATTNTTPTTNKPATGTTTR